MGPMGYLDVLMNSLSTDHLRTVAEWVGVDVLGDAFWCPSDDEIRENLKGAIRRNVYMRRPR